MFLNLIIKIFCNYGVKKIVVFYFVKLGYIKVLKIVYFDDLSGRRVSNNDKLGINRDLF